MEMELQSPLSALLDFQPICNRALGQLDPSLPHSRNAALLPFLYSIHSATANHLLVLTSDFHFNTWHARVTFADLNKMKEAFSITESFSLYLQSFHSGFSSNNVKVELGGPASAVAGKGASSAKLKTVIMTNGEAKEMCLELELLQGQVANDAMSTLVWGLFESLVTAKTQVSQLEEEVNQEKRNTTTILDAVVSGRSSLNSCPSRVTKASLVNRLQSQTLNKEHSMPASHFASTKLSRSTSYSRGSSARCSSLKLAEANSYTRTTRSKGKATDIAEAQASHLCERSSSFIAGGQHLADSSIDKRKYLDVNPEVISKIEAGGENRSEKTDAWARRRYFEWRQDQSLPNKEIEELSLAEFADSLVKFFCMIKKRDGTLFPSDSLGAIFRAFARIINFHYKKLYLQGNYAGPIVDMNRDIMFEKSRLACKEAMKHSILNGGNLHKKQKICERLLTEEHVLQHPANQTTHALGLVRRLCYFAIHRFHIYGCMELYDTTDLEFRRAVDEKGVDYWEYDERRAMHYKSKTVLRDSVKSYDKKVIDCFDKYFAHLPSKPLEREPRRLFLAPITNPRSSDIWYRHENISARRLSKWYRSMGPLRGTHTDIPGYALFNQTGILNLKASCMSYKRGWSSSKAVQEVTSGSKLHLHAIGDSASEELRARQRSITYVKTAEDDNMTSDTDEAYSEGDCEDNDETTDNEIHEANDVHTQIEPSDLDEITL
ncbi:hypothetical protein O6H91_21G046100 [Diphasiastrum complanatum]|uniref:Uncharacterized protein n=1 Tax=Diphasiastrum complanatum TaxID=34168 RepID=A0ACC2AKE3_DIPCM|nr:hypothetical protein O6H91_21G046100 [Diphasiastrum complanatum]